MALTWPARHADRNKARRNEYLPFLCGINVSILPTICINLVTILWLEMKTVLEQQQQGIRKSIKNNGNLEGNRFFRHGSVRYFVFYVIFKPLVGQVMSYIETDPKNLNSVKII